MEAKHRRPRTYSLLVAGRERKAINRNYFNSYVWKPALAEAGVIAPLEESAPDGTRVWEPSREHGYHALRHFYASEQLEAGESVVSLARPPRPRVYAPEVRSLPVPRGRTWQRRHRRRLRVAPK